MISAFDRIFFSMSRDVTITLLLERTRFLPFRDIILLYYIYENLPEKSVAVMLPIEPETYGERSFML